MKYKYHTVYKTVNLITGDYYVGVHSTDDPNDYYLGSGLRLLKDISKLGRYNFKKEILFVFNIPEEAFQKEVELLRSYINDPLCYNLATGGRGLRPGQISPKCLERLRKNSELLTGKPLSILHREKLSKTFTGTILINNGIVAKRWAGDQAIPNGWVKGRFKLKEKRIRKKPHTDQELANISNGVKKWKSTPEQRKLSSERMEKIWEERPDGWTFALTFEERKKITSAGRAAFRIKYLLQIQFRVCYGCFFPFKVRSGYKDATFCSKKCYHRTMSRLY